MTIQDQIKTLIEYSVSLTDAQKSEWLELLPKLNEQGLQKLKQVLIDEVNLFKKEGIDLFPISEKEALLQPAKENMPATVSSNTTDTIKPIPVPPVPPMTSFEKKLATATASKEVAHGGDLEALKQRIEAAKVKEVPKPILKTASPIDMKEIEREVHTVELPAHKEAVIAALPKPMVPKPMVPKPRVAPKPSAPPIVAKPFVPHPTMAPKPLPPLKMDKIVNAPATVEKQFSSVPAASLGKPLSEITTMEDLQKIDLKHLRQGPVSVQLEMIKSKIVEISKASNGLPFYAVAAFEQSPLFKAYLSSGSAMFSGAKAELNQQEFEAVADLKKQIEAL